MELIAEKLTILLIFKFNFAYVGKSLRFKITSCLVTIVYDENLSWDYRSFWVSDFVYHGIDSSIWVFTNWMKGDSISGKSLFNLREKWTIQNVSWEIKIEPDSGRNATSWSSKIPGQTLRNGLPSIRGSNQSSHIPKLKPMKLNQRSHCGNISTIKVKFLSHIMLTE